LILPLESAVKRNNWGLPALTMADSSGFGEGIAQAIRVGLCLTLSESWRAVVLEVHFGARRSRGS
jgi:hypothetical protein